MMTELAYTLRCHPDCFDAWCNWHPDEDGTELLASGHLPPCALAWAAPTTTDCTCCGIGGA